MKWISFEFPLLLVDRKIDRNKGHIKSYIRIKKSKVIKIICYFDTLTLNISVFTQVIYLFVGSF